MQAEQVVKPGRLSDLCALLVFSVVGFVGVSAYLAAPGGQVICNFKLAFFLLAFFRLAWHIYRRTSRFADYLIYCALVIGFCLWADTR